jgi:hypothetical protein
MPKSAGQSNVLGWQIGAHQVFDEMAARTKLSNFWMNFGGLQTYIICSRIVVVWVNLAKICKITKCM